MKKYVLILTTLLLAGCNEQADTGVKHAQAEKAAQAANSITFTQNAEIDNIKRHLS